jgi:dTDP-glucose 4,6-dehydratase
MIANIRDGKNLPVYGEGKNIRDWIYVEDHNRAVWLIMNRGRTGEKYNIGGENEWQNIRLLHKVIELTCAELGKTPAEVEKTIVHVKDRPGHDMRYAIDCTKIKTELGWTRKVTFEEGLKHTVQWNLSHKEWLDHILSGEYTKWVTNNYREPLKTSVFRGNSENAMFLVVILQRLKTRRHL